MKTQLLGLLIFISGISHSQFNTMEKLNIGVSRSQFKLKTITETFSDTSDIYFEFISASPTISYSHDIFLGDIVSIGGSAGFQYLNMQYDHQYFGSPYTWLNLNAAFSIFYNKKIEYYIKLRAGASYWFQNTELLSEHAQKFFPDNFNPIAGVTLVGINYFVNSKLGVNFEYSIWSPEMATFGLSYRYYRGELPPVLDSEEDHNFPDPIDLEKDN